MKISKQQLKQLIKEQYEVLNEKERQFELQGARVMQDLLIQLYTAGGNLETTTRNILDEDLESLSFVRGADGIDRYLLPQIDKITKLGEMIRSARKAELPSGAFPDRAEPTDSEFGMNAIVRRPDMLQEQEGLASPESIAKFQEKDKFPEREYSMQAIIYEIEKLNRRVKALEKMVGGAGKEQPYQKQTRPDIFKEVMDELE